MCDDAMVEGTFITLVSCWDGWLGYLALVVAGRRIDLN
jgi:hypothetical protein